VRNDELAPPDARSRKSLLKLAAAGIAGLVGGAAARPERALALDGDAVKAGSTTTATNKTKLTSTYAIANNGAFVVEATGADWAIEGNSGQIGVLGSGFVGVTGTGTVGGYFSGTLNAISLEAQPDPGPPTSGVCTRGDMLVDSTGVLYMCVADGNPGTWIRVSHGGVRLLGSPVRAYDSRDGAAVPLPSGSGNNMGSPRTVNVLQAVPAIPPGALGIVGNLTVTATTGGGFAAIWPGGAWPGTSNINWSDSNATLANAVTVGLSGGSVALGSWTRTDVILDVAGYIL
jgi:hypothetical protein